MTPQERAQKIAADWFGAENLNDTAELTESIRVAIVEATTAEVEKRRDAEAFALSMEMLLRCHAEKIKRCMAGTVVCLCCGELSDGMDAARAHATICPKDPAVQRLSAKMQDIDQALGYLGQVLDSEPAGYLQSAIDALKREPI